MDILQQIGQLVLGSVPTMLLFIFLLLAYRLLVHAPLTRTLATRREQTEGAMEKAKEAIAAAEAKTRDYEERLRAARRNLQAAREQQMARWAAEREDALRAARDAFYQILLGRQQQGGIAGTAPTAGPSADKGGTTKGPGAPTTTPGAPTSAPAGPGGDPRAR